MASPTRAEVITQIQNAVRVIDNFLVGAQTVIADQDTLTQSLETDFASEATSGAALFRSGAARALENASAVLSPHLVSFAYHIINSPERNVQTVIDRIYQDFVDNADTIQSRGVVYGAPAAAGGNVGDGSVFRLTVDENAFDLEAVHPDTKTIRCVADQTLGSIKHRELFTIEGANAEIDTIAIVGSGRKRTDDEVRAVDSSDSPLTNAGFDSVTLGSAAFAGDVATLALDSDIPGWTVTAGALTDLQVDRTTSIQFRDIDGVTTPLALRFLTNATIEQAFSVNRVVLDRNVPAGFLLPVRRENLADGTLTLTMGANSQAFTVSTLTNGAWNLLALDQDSDLWPANFNTTDPKITIAYTGRTTGEIVIDELMAPIPFFLFDGTWWLITGGETKFLENDEFTAADSIASDSKIQKWLWRNYGRHLPHSGAPTIADPV